MIAYLKINIEHVGINPYIMSRFKHLVEFHQKQRKRLHTNGRLTNYQRNTEIGYTPIGGSLITNVTNK